MRFAYKVVGPGWATASVAEQDQRFEFTVSYLTDVPRILIDRLLYLADGATIARAVWDRDPGDFVWHLAVGRQGRLRVQIWEFTGWGDEPNSYRPGPIGESGGLLRFDARSTVSEFSAAVAQGFRRCIDNMGITAYRREWNEHEFPTSLLETLERQARS